jgi:hypothetical protein
MLERHLHRIWSKCQTAVKWGKVFTTWAGKVMPWIRTDVRWKCSNWTWGDKAVAEEIVDVSGGGDEHAIAGWEKQYPKKKKKIIKILCKIKNKKFDESKDYKEIKLTVKDVKLVAKEVLGIDLKVKVIKK